MLISHALQRPMAVVVSILYLSIAVGDARAQVISTTVGGVLINPQGVLQAAPAGLSRQQALEIQKRVNQAPLGFRTPGAWRAISLRELESALTELPAGAPIPIEIRFLGGLQRVESIIVDPQNQDVILAGPSEEWMVHPSGDLVGATTGWPALMLDDLLVALRSVQQNRGGVISCSIDPTAEGRKALDSFLAKVKRFEPAVVPRIEQTLGNQVVTIEGVPRDTHFAAVLAAADFQMKCYAMHLQPAPIPELPSFLQLVQATRSIPRELMPRWWLAVDYNVPTRSEDQLVWSLPPSKVKIMTEDEIVEADGTVTGTGKANPIAQRWANAATVRYEQLARADIVFARLQQVMDWALIAAIFDRHDLLTTAGCELPLLTSNESPLRTENWFAPETVPSHVSFVHVGRKFVITASGGVEMDPWKIVENPRTDPQLERITSPPTRQLSVWCQDFQ